jgi:hypothetical protein
MGTLSLLAKAASLAEFETDDDYEQVASLNERDRGTDGTVGPRVSILRSLYCPLGVQTKATTLHEWHTMLVADQELRKGLLSGYASAAAASIGHRLRLRETFRW